MQVSELKTYKLSATDNGSTYEYTYFNENVTCSASDPAYTAWDSTTTFNKGDIVLVDSIKRIFRCAAPTSTGQFPCTYPDVWVDYGAVNSYAAFDQMLSTATSSDVDFNITMDFNHINSLGFIGMDEILSLHVVQTDTTTGNVVYDKTISLRDYGVLSLYDYWYAPIINREKIHIIDLEYLPASTVSVDFTVSSQGGKVGAVVSGFLHEIGVTLYGSSVGYDDLSRYKVDDYGVTSFDARPAIDKVEAQAVIDLNSTDVVIQKLKRIRGKHNLFIGDERDRGLQSMMILGYIKKLNIPIENPVKAKFPLSIVGTA